MEDPGDEDSILLEPVDQEVTRSSNSASGGSTAALAEMPGEDTLAKLGSSGANGAIPCRGGVAEGGDDQRLVAMLRLIAELSSRPSEDLRDV